MERTELLSPAGDLESALAAFGAGADAVYCGLGSFSARAFAGNFSLDSLRLLLRHAASRGKKVYVAFNTLANEADLDAAVPLLAELEDAAPAGLIVQDLGLAALCRRHFPALPLHASTQLVVHNLAGAVALRDLGFRRAVLARELSLDEVSSIKRKCGDLELECFIHGALCYSVSGLCLFSALEKKRSGNRGACAYCCRMPRKDVEGRSLFPFSMKDLRLGVRARSLAAAGVASLKIEGRMKSPLYVAAATAYYRRILDGDGDAAAQAADLETVFSRRTTTLYLDGRDEDPVDPVSIGHLGSRIGEVKRISRDRDGRPWLRFRTTRALEKHDGLQFEGHSPETALAGRHPGFGISLMRRAISRSHVFEVAAGEDVEVLLPDALADSGEIREGDGVFCTMSNAVKRRFTTPSLRPEDCPGARPVDIRIAATAEELKAYASSGGIEVSASCAGEFTEAKDPSGSEKAAHDAFSRFGGTDYTARTIDVSGLGGRFAPKGMLNSLRRDIVTALDNARRDAIARKTQAALEDDSVPPETTGGEEIPRRILKVREGQKIPEGEWDEIVVAPAPEAFAAVDASRLDPACRIALPVWTGEYAFPRLRTGVKRLVRAGFRKWEASDLATLSLLRSCGIDDIVADWTLYAFNSRALALLSSLGVKRFVASPENTSANIAYLAESGYAMEFLRQQSTPLFISLTRPAATELEDLAVFDRHGLWATTRRTPRLFDVPSGAATRHDLSWDPEP